MDVGEDYRNPDGGPGGCLGLGNDFAAAGHPYFYDDPNERDPEETLERHSSFCSGGSGRGG